MSSAANKTGRGWRADVRNAGNAMETFRPARPMKPAADKTRRGRRADTRAGGDAVESSRPAKPMEAAADKTRRGRRADVGDSGAVKVMKIAAAKAAAKSAASKTAGDGRGAGAEIRRGGNAAGAKAMQAWRGAESMKRRRAMGA
jgi:hypothetical protein